MALSRWLQASRAAANAGPEGDADAESHATRLFFVWLGLQLLHMLLLFSVSLLWAVGSVRACTPPRPKPRSPAQAPRSQLPDPSSGLVAAPPTPPPTPTLHEQVRASKELHHSTVKRLLFAPLSWYNSTPSGRILSRYTADIGVVDTQISLYVDNAVQMVLLCFIMVLLVMVVAPTLAPFGVVALLLYVLILVMTEYAHPRLEPTTIMPAPGLLLTCSWARRVNAAARRAR